MILCGVDPGVSGAAVILDDQRCEVMAVLNLPIVRSKSLAWVDGEALWLWLQGKGPQVVILEQVGRLPGDHKKANVDAMIRVAGGIEAIVTGLRLPLVHVLPSVWKRRAGLLKRSDAERIALAKSRLAWPQRAVNEHQADAALVALYGRTAAAPPKPPKRAKEVPQRLPENLPLFGKP